MVIFQPDRVLLKKQVKKEANYITGKVLDVGAGSYSRYAGLFNYDEYIKLDVEDNDDTIDVIASADDIPFDDNSFDSVVSTQVLEHVRNPKVVVGEMHRVLKKGGYALITIPQKNELHSEPEDFYRYTCFGLKELFESAGFEIVNMEQRGGFFTLKAQMNIRYLIDRFDLYDKPFLGKVASKFFKVYGTFMMVLDRVDASKANRKHTIGWCAIIKK